MERRILIDEAVRDHLGRPLTDRRTGVLLAAVDSSVI
jgi:hypothetical protein